MLGTSPVSFLLGQKPRGSLVRMVLVVDSPMIPRGWDSIFAPFGVCGGIEGPPRYIVAKVAYLLIFASADSAG